MLILLPLLKKMRNKYNLLRALKSIFEKINSQNLWNKIIIFLSTSLLISKLPYRIYFLMFYVFYFFHFHFQMKI